MLGNITITEANIRQNTGKEKKNQSKKELPDIQTGLVPHSLLHFQAPKY